MSPIRPDSRHRFCYRPVKTVSHAENVALEPAQSLSARGPWHERARNVSVRRLRYPLQGVPATVRCVWHGRDRNGPRDVPELWDELRRLRPPAVSTVWLGRGRPRQPDVRSAVPITGKRRSSVVSPATIAVRIRRRALHRRRPSAPRVRLHQSSRTGSGRRSRRRCDRRSAPRASRRRRRRTRRAGRRFR